MGTDSLKRIPKLPSPHTPDRTASPARSPIPSWLLLLPLLSGEQRSSGPGREGGESNKRNLQVPPSHCHFGRTRQWGPRPRGRKDAACAPPTAGWAGPQLRGTGRVYPVEALQHRTAGPGRSRHMETLPPQSALKGQGDVTEGAEAAGWGRAEALAHCCPSWHLG